MRVERMLVFVLTAITIGATIVCSACGDSTVHAAQMNTSAVLTGACGGSNINTAFMTGLGSTDSTCNSATGSDNTGLPMPSAGVLANLRVLSPNTGAVVTVLINGTPSPLTCTIPGSGAFAPGSSCSDSAHTANVAAGDLVAVKLAATAQSTVQGTQVALEKQ